MGTPGAVSDAVGTVAIVGAGRIGVALAKLWRERGVGVVGFLGRHQGSASVERALRWIGAGRDLSPLDLSSVDLVLVAVPDDALVSVIERLAAHSEAVASRSVWLHASGVHDLSVFASVVERLRGVAALHPLCPVPTVDAGLELLPRACATLAVDSSAGAAAVTALRQQVGDLARGIGMRVIALRDDADRALYHATCALAANGTTALVGVVEQLFSQVLAEPAAVRDASMELMGNALRLCAQLGPAGALSGPVVREDCDVLVRHRHALRGPDRQRAAAVYTDLMHAAVDLAESSATVDADGISALHAALEEVQSGR